MTDFVRYSLGIEAPDPNFFSVLQVVFDELGIEVTASPQFEGGIAVRNAHAKGYGLARGKVEILGDLLPEYAQGIYSKPGRHEAMIHFSNGQPHLNTVGRVGAEASAAPPYVANPNLTVAETRRLDKIGKVVDEFLDKVG